MSTEPIEDRYRSSGSPDSGAAQLLLQVEVENPELGISGAEWDPSTERIHLYATASVDSVKKVAARYGLGSVVEPRQAKYSASDMSAEIRKLVGPTGQLPSAEHVVSALPALDGSLITLTIDEAFASRRSTLVIPSVGPEVRVEFGAPARLALRNHAPGTTSTTNYRYSGAYMRPSSGGCTTGYRGVRLRTRHQRCSPRSTARLRRAPEHSGTTALQARICWAKRKGRSSALAIGPISRLGREAVFRRWFPESLSVTILSRVPRSIR